jgi:hypothetical protein
MRFMAPPNLFQALDNSRVLGTARTCAFHQSRRRRSVLWCIFGKYVRRVATKWTHGWVAYGAEFSHRSKRPLVFRTIAIYVGMLESGDN